MRAAQRKGEVVFKGGGGGENEVEVKTCGGIMNML